MRIRHQRYARAGGGYRPPHAWLGSPGDGVAIRPRTNRARWRFRWRQLRILLLALLIAALAWPLVLERGAV